jgi:hypothetical protein
MFNGFAYVISVLAVRIVFQSPQLQSLWKRRSRIVTGVIASWCFLCLLGYATLYRQIFRDGNNATGNLLLNTVVSVDELQMIAWMRDHISREDLVLSPTDQAAWFATVPTHSFGSHDYLSMSFADQVAFADNFYKGSLPPQQVERTLTDYGVRWVVVPSSSTAKGYFKDRTAVFTSGALSLYQRPDAEMKPYPGLRVVRPDLAAKRSLSQLLCR